MVLCLDATSRNEGLDFALTGEGILGEEGGERVGSVGSTAAAGFCSKPKEAMSSTKEGRGVDIV